MTNKLIYAKNIVSTLASEGFEAFFVGGYVRDMLLQIPSTDIDIATNAPVEKIVKLFPKTLLIGASFGIVVVLIDEFSFEVSSFREDGSYQDGRRPDFISTGTIITDSVRRDFTINALFYDPIKKVIIDHVEGQIDLKNQLIRTVGNPFLRFLEDRLRMVRACRFAAVLNFKLEKKTHQAILQESPSLYPAVSKERVHQEFLKIEKSAYKYRFMMLMYASGLLQQIFPVFQAIPFFTFKKWAYYLKGCQQTLPLPIFLAPLFQHISNDAWPEALLDLKASKKDWELSILWNESLSILFPLIPSIKSIHFFTKLGNDLIIQMHSLLCASKEESNKFLQKIDAFKKKFSEHILRAAKKKFPLTSADLVKEGISPGKIMGDLLRKSEELAIEHNTSDKKILLQLLKNSSL